MTPNRYKETFSEPDFGERNLIQISVGGGGTFQRPRFAIWFQGDISPGGRDFASINRGYYNIRGQSKEKENAFEFTRKSWNAEDFSFDSLRGAVKTYAERVLSDRISK